MKESIWILDIPAGKKNYFCKYFISFFSRNEGRPSNLLLVFCNLVDVESHSS